MNLAKSLKIALAQKELRQKDLADKLNVSDQLISRWAIKGTISPSNLEALCSVLDMPVSEFVALGEDG